MTDFLINNIDLVTNITFISCSIIIFALVGFRSYLKYKEEGATAFLGLIVFLFIYSTLTFFFKIIISQREIILNKISVMQVDYNFILYWICIPIFFTVLIINIINASKRN